MYTILIYYYFNKNILLLATGLLTLEVLRAPQAVHRLCSFLLAKLS